MKAYLILPAIVLGTASFALSASAMAYAYTTTTYTYNDPVTGLVGGVVGATGAVVGGVFEGGRQIVYGVTPRTTTTVYHHVHHQ